MHSQPHHRPYMYIIYRAMSFHPKVPLNCQTLDKCWLFFYLETRTTTTTRTTRTRTKNTQIFYKNVLKVCWRCLRGNWEVSLIYLKGVLKVSWRCLKHFFDNIFLRHKICFHTIFRSCATSIHGNFRPTDRPA